MKANKIITGLLVLVLFFSLAAASMVPTPVTGKVTLPGYDSLAGLTLTQENLYTKVSYETELDANGYYIMDWANYPHFSGNQVKITIKACESNPACQKTITLIDGKPIFTDFVVPSSFEVVKESSKVYVCHDGSTVENKDSCPLSETPPKEVITEKEIVVEKEYVDGKEVIVPKETIKEVVIEHYVCENGDLVDAPEECGTSSSLLWQLISAAFVIFTGAAMTMFYLNRRKYRWIPGMIGIIKKKQAEADALHKAGKKKEAKKKLDTALKTMKTITKKYLESK